MKDQLDLLLKEWVQFQQLRVANRQAKPNEFDVQVVTKADYFSAALKVTNKEILIDPCDERKLGIFLNEKRLKGCAEIGNKIVILTPRFAEPLKIKFRTQGIRNQALLLIRKLIRDENCDSYISPEDELKDIE